MTVPQTYAEWTGCLDAFKKGDNDEETLACMEKGVLSWTSAVAERFSSQLFDVINYRLDNTAKKFQRNLDMSRNNETAIVQAIMNVRRELKILKRLANMDAIPVDKRTYFTQQLLDYAGNAQTALVNSAKNDRTGKLASTFRNHRIDVF
jgi:hypothetical protein